MIRVGSSPVLSSAGIYIAQEQGYFREQGLTVEIIDFKNSGAPLTAPLAAGELEVGAGNFSAGLFNAMNQGAGIRLVADKGHLERGHEYLALLVREDHKRSGRFKSLRDLKGFTFGLTALNGVSQEILADRFLKAAGLNAKDVKFVKMSYAEMNAAFASKSLDATIQLEPYVTLAEKKGIASRVGNACDYYPDQPSAGIFYSPAFLKRHEDAVKFMIAYLKGVRDYEAAFVGGKNRAQIVSILKKHIQVDSDEAWSSMIPVGLDPNGAINQKALQSDLEWYREKAYIQKIPAIASIVDDSIAEQALRILGRAPRATQNE